MGSLKRSGSSFKTEPTAIWLTAHRQGVAQLKDQSPQLIVILAVQFDSLNQRDAVLAILERVNFSIPIYLDTTAVSHLARVGREVRGL